MKKYVATGVGVAAALVMVFGSGVAKGEPVDWLNGMTYEKAKETASYTTLKIVSRQGSYLPTEKCLVFGAQTYSGGYAVNLNCNDAYAGTTGHPGGSAATPEGNEANKVLGFIEVWNKGNIDSCIKDAASAQWCLGQCDKYGTCSTDTLAAFSSHS